MGKKSIKGTLEKPRLSVFRSKNNIYAQVIDDTSANTILSSSTREKTVQDKLTGGGSNCSAAKIVGEVLGSRLKEKNIQKIVFDRGRYPYHGRVAALADGVRESGLKF
jgi:large subunit ribosomal protein L18